MSNIWRTIQGNLNLDELSNSNLINNEQCGRTLSQVSLKFDYIK